MWVHHLETNIILTLDCLRTALWVITFILSLGSRAHNNSITPLPPYHYIILLLAQYHPCPAWRPAFTLMLALLTLLTHDIRDSLLWKFQISRLFSNVYIIQKSVRSLTTCVTFHTMPFFIGGNFHPVLNPQTWKTTPQQLSVLLIKYLWSCPPYTSSAIPWLAAWRACVLLYTFGVLFA